MLRSGINAWAFPAGWSLRQKMEKAAACGFDCFEPTLEKAGELSLKTSIKGAEKIRKMADKLGLKIESFATGLYWDCSPTSDDPKIRTQAIGILKKQIELGKALGADTILVVPGAVDVFFLPHIPRVPYQKVYDRALAAIKKVEPQTRKAKVSIGIENVWNKFLLSPVEMKDFLNKIGSEFVGCYFDVGNILYCGYPDDWILTLGDAIKKIHVKDYKNATGNVLASFTNLLYGDVDWPLVVKALRKIKYDGPLTAELFPPVNVPERLIEETAKSIRAILKLS